MTPKITTVALSVLLLISGCARGSGVRPAVQDDRSAPVVGVILPDRKSSTRWEELDQPLLEGAFGRAGIQAVIENAEGDAARFATLVDRMIDQRVRVLVMTALDASSSRAAQRKAASAGISLIDYERLTPGGHAEYHVGFDNHATGELQAEGLLECLAGRPGARVIELLGGEADPNTAEFAAGNQFVLAGRYGKDDLRLVARRNVPDWDPGKARELAARILDAERSVDGVLAANDGIAGAVIEELRARGLAGQVAVTGMDATIDGLRAILRGEQCMSVYKPIRYEAEAAAQLALALARGDDAAADDLAAGNVRDETGKRDVKAVLLGPELAHKRTIASLVSSGAVRARQLCANEFAELCRLNDIATG